MHVHCILIFISLYHTHFADLCSSYLLFILSSPLERLLESIGLLEDGLEVLLDVGRCHGSVHIDLVEG